MTTPKSAEEIALEVLQKLLDYKYQTDWTAGRSHDVEVITHALAVFGAQRFEDGKKEYQELMCCNSKKTRREALEKAAKIFGDYRHCCEDCPCSGKADEVRALIEKEMK